MSQEINEIKYEVAMATRILAAMGLATNVTASLGHVSMRIPTDQGKFVVKGRGYEIDALEAMQYHDMIVCDLEGYKVDGPARSTQCSEVKIHSCIYRERPDVQAVVHIHPRNCVLMSIQERPIRPMCQEGVHLVREPLPVYQHCKTVWSEEEGMELVRTLGQGKIALMKGHGITVTGKTLQDVVTSAQQLEEQARMNIVALQTFGPDCKQIPLELVDEMTNRPKQDEYPHFKELMQRIGGNPPRDGVWNSYKAKVTGDMVRPW